MDDPVAAWQAAVAGPLADPELPFEDHWATFRAIYGDAAYAPAWVPDEGIIERANLTWLANEVGANDYPSLHAWSARARDAFWAKTIDRLHVTFDTQPEAVRDPESPVEDPEWLPGGRFNAAALCLQAPPDRVAIIAGKEGTSDLRNWTYGELEDLADRVSLGLEAQGLRAGDSVALYMPMTVECVAAYLGIVQAGMVVVSIPDSFAPGEVATRLRLGEAKIIITVDSFSRGGKQVPMAPKAREAVHGMEPRPGIVVVGDPGPDLSWKTLIRDDSGYHARPRHPQAVTNILFSSGTTGEPKAIPWTHLSPLKAAADGHWHQDIHVHDVVAWPTNIGWMMGPWLIYATLMNGATMALYEGVPTSQEFLEFVRQARVSVFGLVPAIARAWREQGVAPHSLPHVRIWSSTGEASNPHDALYVMALSGYRAPLIEYCGGTEIAGGHITGTVLQPQVPATFSTAAMGLDFVVLDEDGTSVDQGMGEIFLIPPSIGLSQRLLNRNHHQEYYEGCPAGPAGQVLRRHGDELECLPGGYYRAQGRADDTMNLGGIKVGSIELETVMNGDDAVSETAAVAVPPDGGGADRLVVFVVLARGHDDEGLHDRLQARIKERLNPLFRIHDVVVIEALPRTASNKVMRRELRSQYLVA